LSDFRASTNTCAVAARFLDTVDHLPIPGVEVALRYRPVGESVFNTGRDQKSLATRFSDAEGIARFGDLQPDLDYYVVSFFPAFTTTFRSVACQAVGSNPESIELKRPLDVSLIQLIANPSTWHDRPVRVIGFLRVEFEGNALYLHEEDLKRHISKNAIWVGLTLGQMSKYSARSGHYVIMEGVFDATSNGHMGLFSGTLKQVTRCDLWRL